MKILLLCVGKTDANNFESLIALYQKRLTHYVQFSIESIPTAKAIKKNNPNDKLDEEAKRIQEKIKPGDRVILLDENGQMQDSKAFSKTLEKMMVSGSRRLVFVVGGAYGFSKQLKQRFTEKLSLSRMTFSHQMIRLFFCEQLYRAFTILNNHPYHNN